MGKSLEFTKEKNTERTYLLIGSLLMFIGSVMYSSKAVMVKLAYQYDIDSTSLLALRMGFSLPIYLLILWWRQSGPDKGKTISTKDWRSAILLGVMGYYIASFLDFIGLQYITAGLERLILFSYPTMVVLMLAIFYKKRITPIVWIALLLTYIGIAIAFMDNVNVAQVTNLNKGASLVFGAAFAYAIYVVGSGELVAKVGTFRFTSIGMIAAASMIIIQHGITHQWQLFDFHPNVYWLSIFIAIFATVVPSFLVMEGIKRIGSANASIISSVGPISTIVLAYFLLDEKFGNIQMIGTLVVIAGVLIISLNKNKTT